MRSPDPLALPLEPVPANTAVQAAPVMLAGIVSATVAPVTKLGPALVTTIVYVIPIPGMYVALPSVFVICRSACGTDVSVSAAVLLPGAGSVVPTGALIVAVFTRFPVAVGDTVPVTV